MNEFELNKYVKSQDYTKSPFRYPGGKFYALKHILPFNRLVSSVTFRKSRKRPYFKSSLVHLVKTKTSNSNNEFSLNSVLLASSSKYNQFKSKA